MANKALTALDNPVLFIFAVTIGVCCTKPILKWGLDRAGMPGAAKVFS